MNLILKLKNWQIFLAMTFIPFVLVIVSFKLLDLGKYELDYLMSFFTLVYYSIFMWWNYAVIKYFNRTEQILKKSYLKTINWLIIIVVAYGAYLALPFDIKTNSENVISKLSFLIMPFFAFTFFLSDLWDSKNY